MEPRSDERGDRVGVVTARVGRGASMKPRSDERGDQFGKCRDDAFGQLQWSHARMNVEMLCNPPQRLIATWLQWSHARMNVEMLPTADATVQLALLQWSHARMNVEMSRTAPRFNGATLG